MIATLLAAPSAIGAPDPVPDPVFSSPLATASEGCNTVPSERGLAPSAADTGVNSGTAAKPDPAEVYFNAKDISERGVDDTNDAPWKFAITWAQYICGAAPGSTIDLSFFFIRAVSNSGIPETDTEVILRALEWVHKNRGVTVNLIVEGTNSCPTEYATDCFPILPDVFRDRLINRFTGPDTSNPRIGKVYTCFQGCMNRARTGTNSYAINHEKFVAISKTIWDAKPLVMSSSGNIARSQMRSYHQELAVVWGDQSLYDQFRYRYLGMQSCSSQGDNCAYLKTGPNPQQLRLSTASDRYPNVWVDPFVRRATDANRGTEVGFSAQIATESDTNIYFQQLQNVDCAVDPKVRIAMFKMSDQKAQQFTTILKKLKSQGCDIKTMLTSEIGKTAASPTVLNLFNKANLWIACSRVPMHTKVVLIGPSGGTRGRVLAGTQNIDISGQYLSEEHIISFDPRSTTNATTRASLEDVYAKYYQEWLRISEFPTAASQGAC